MNEIKLIETTESLSRESAENVLRHLTDGFNQLDYQSNAGFSEFWFGKGDPKEKVKQFGTDAVKVFTLHAIAEEAIAKMKQALGEEYTKKTIPDGYTFTPNADGSATITGEYIPPVVEEEEVVEEEIVEEEVIEE